MNTMKAGWYVLYTKPRHEKAIAGYLQRLHIEFFLPLTKTLKIWQGKKRCIYLPLFPSYIFVKLDSLQEYFNSLGIPSVLYFVRDGNKVAQVNDIIIDKLKRLCTDNAVEHAEITSENFSKGTIININAGPFKDFLCEVIQRNGKYKILVRIELLQRSIIVDLPSCCLNHEEPKSQMLLDKFRLKTAAAH